MNGWSAPMARQTCGRDGVAQSAHESGPAARGHSLGCRIPEFARKMGTAGVEYPQPGAWQGRLWRMGALQMGTHLASWADGPVKRSLIEFLFEVTQGPDALPVAERVAAFDNDGTLACEKPHTALAAFLQDRLGATGSSFSGPGSGHRVLRELGVLFAGATTDEYDAQASEFLARARHPRFGRPYPLLTYQPMLELVYLLHALEFSVFMCTDSSRDFMRVIAGPAYGLRRERVIGSEVRIDAAEGRLVRSATPVPMDDGPGKVVHLWDRAGRRPVLAAGNAVGDIAMLAAAQYALVVHHDDATREYVYDDEKILQAAAQNRWSVISMRDDFTALWPTHLRDGGP